MASGPTKTEQFEKEKGVPPSQYHLESSLGDVKDHLTSYQLQSYSGGRHLKDFGLLSKLGTGISVVDFDQDIPTIGELVDQKRGNRQRKGSKATIPLEIVGCDTGYGDGVSISGSKYILVLVDQCTTNWFVLTFVRRFGNSSLMLVDSLRRSNVILTLN